MTDRRKFDADGNVIPIWLGVVEDTVVKFKGASVEEQETICKQLAQKYESEEAGAKARELFGEGRVEIEFERVKGKNELTRRWACEGFEQKNGLELGNRLRAKLGLGLKKGRNESVVQAVMMEAATKVAEPEVAEAETEETEEAPNKEDGDEGEGGWIEDDTNPANNIRRKLWRIGEGIEWINPVGRWIEDVGSALWFMSEGRRDDGCQMFVKWGGERLRSRWGSFGDRVGAVERIYREAQKEGWRYPIAHNLNRLDEMTVRVEAALIRGGAEIYQLGNRLVRPVRVEVWATKGRKTRIALLVPIDGGYLKGELTKTIDFFRWKKNDEREGCGAPGDVVGAVLSRYGKWKFPVVTGVITSPTLRRDGSLLAKEGWDPESGLLVVGPLPEMPPVAMKPGRKDAERAIELLDRLLDGFPWVDRASRSVGLSGLITPVVRPALGCVPLHSASAPKAGTGKSYLWDTAAGICLGDAMPIISAGANVEEMEKRIDAQVIEGVGLWSIDNVSKFVLGGDGLCQVIERPMYKPRVLGKSEMRERRNIWSVFATGNNLRFRDDITRRVLRAGMDAKMERPELRKFDGNPFERVLGDRGLYLWAALTVVRAYQAAGRPGRLGWIGDTFGEWSDSVRSALVWLGYEDPVLSMETVRADDPSRKARREMFQAIFNAYGEKGMTAADMIADAKRGAIWKPGKSVLKQQFGGAADDLKAALVQYIGERLDARYLGNKLGTDRGNITDGLTLDSKYDGHRKIHTWIVTQVTED